MKTFQDGDPLFGVMVNAIANLWPNGTAVLSGCTPTGSAAARQVTVAAGTVVIGGTVRPVSQQTKTLDAAAFDRYDLISVNTSGTVVVTKGTEERRVPALPANSVPIAICLIETGQTALPADRIYDTRMDALRLSVLNIDGPKNWQGQDIVNIGALQNQTGNIGARTGFVDVPGDVVRKTFTPNIVINSGESKTIVSFTIPAEYSTEFDSNLRIGITKTSTSYTVGIVFDIERNGVQIGTKHSAYDKTYETIDTTDGCKAGDTIVIKATYGGDGRDRPVTITKVEVKSARKADIPAYKVFAETGAW